MPKSITATSISLETIWVERDEVDVVQGLTAVLNVAYGESRVREEYDLWSVLSSSQKTAVQSLYYTLLQTAQAAYLA